MSSAGSDHAQPLQGASSISACAGHYHKVLRGQKRFLVRLVKVSEASQSGLSGAPTDPFRLAVLQVLSGLTLGYTQAFPVKQRILNLSVKFPAAEPAAGHMGTRERGQERGWGRWGLCALVFSTPQEALGRGPGAEDGGRDGRCVLWEEFPSSCDNCDARSAVGGKDLLSGPSKALPLALVSRPQRMQGLCSFRGSCRETGSRVECPRVPVLAPQPWSHLFSSWSEALWHLLLLTC